MARLTPGAAADHARDAIPLHALSSTARRKALRYWRIGELLPAFTSGGVAYFDRYTLADWGVVDVGGKMRGGEWLQ